MYKFGVLVCTCPKQRRYLKACLESYGKIKPEIIVSIYDGAFKESDENHFQKVLPPSETMALSDIWMFNEKINGPHRTWRKQQIYGIEILKRNKVDYIFSVNGDCWIEKPEGFVELFGKIIKEKGDILACHNKGTSLGTMGYIAKIDSAKKLLNLIEEHWKEKFVGDSSEHAFGNGYRILGLKVILVENQETNDYAYGKKGTWFNTIGFRHLHAHEKWRKSRWHKPLPKFVQDERYLRKKEFDALKIFWETGKIDHLLEMKYWHPVKRGHGDEAKKFYDEF